MTYTCVGRWTELGEELVWKLDSSIETANEEYRIDRELHPRFTEESTVVGDISLEGSSIDSCNCSSKGS